MGISTVIDDDVSLSLAVVRNNVVPWLPPPLVKAMKAFDGNPQIQSMFHEYTDEPATLLLISLLSIFVVYECLCQISSSSSSAIIIDENEKEKFLIESPETESYQETVVFLGPSGGGKTTLFHMMQQYHKKQQDDDSSQGLIMPMTVTSMKANTTILNFSKENGDDASVRLLDYPGLYLTQKENEGESYSNYIEKRIVFLLDSTRPIPVDTAQTLHNIILNNTHGEVIAILVVCQKSDVSNAKHWRRMKIQLRTELERWRKVTKTTQKDTLSSTSTSTQTSLPPYTDLDKLPNGVTMHFVSASSSGFASKNGDGLNEIWHFIKDGTILSDSSSVLSSSRKK